MKILVIAAHPDDEVIGMGGTIKKLALKGNELNLCVVSEGASAQYNDKKMIKIRRDACEKSGKFLGISKFYFLDYPDMRLDSIPHLEINRNLEKIIKNFKPKIVYSVSPNDSNKDHQKVFESSLIASRPQSSSVKQFLTYEVLGSVKNSFHPTVYENIEKEFPSKIKALNFYNTEIRKFPHPRSIESIENLAIYRGVQSGLRKAEAFELIQLILD